MQGKVATVFGGSGFLGRHLVKRLADAGVTIRVPTRDPNRAVHLKPLGEVGQIVLEPFAGTADEARLAPYLEGADFAVNLIGILAERRPGDFARVHRDLARAIAAAGKAHGVSRLVHVSAIGADAASPSLYAQTKAAGEKAVREAFPEASIMRPSIVFGPEDRFFNRFARIAQLSPVIPVVSPKTRFQPVYVGDVAAAICTALQEETAAGETFELGGPRIYTFEQLLRYMLKVLRRRRLIVELPGWLARFQARFFELLPEPPLTRDQILLLQRDNVVAEGAKGLAELGITPTPLEVIVPQYLAAYARGDIRLPAA